MVKRVVKKYVGPGGAALPSRESKGSDQSPSPLPTGPLGLAPSISAEGVPEMVKRERRFGIFGPRETVTGVEPQFRTLLQLGVRVGRGLLKRRFETVYVFLDGLTGKQVSINRGLEVARGFEKLLGLTMLQVEVLREVHPDADTSALDVASRIGESKAVVSRVLNFLNGRRLVRSIEVRRKRLYRRLIDLPEEPSEFLPLELSPVDVGRSRVISPRLKEEDVRDAVKGLWEGSDLESFETFLYPVFKVELVLKRKHRQVLIDGRNGRELVA